MRNLAIQELLRLNQYVQKVISKDDVNIWFLSLPDNEKPMILKNLWMLAIQAQVTEADLSVAIAKSGLKESNTPVIMLSKGNVSFQNRGYRLSELKGTVLNQAFSLVLECFASAEMRRKIKEGGLACNHWWHKDLSDNSIVSEILKNNI